MEKSKDNKNNPNINYKRQFGLSWLDSSYLETLLPGSPWQNVSDILSPALAETVRQQFHNDHRKQMIVELVGKQFKRSYMTDIPDNPWILLPPNMTDDQTRKLENEAKSWLQIQINDIAIAKNCMVRPNDSEEHLSNEMRDYLDHTYSVVHNSLDRYLYIKQKKLNPSKDGTNQNNEPEKDFDVKSVRSLNMLTKYASKNTLRDLLKNKKNLPTIQEKTRKYHGELSSELSEILGDSLLYILRKDPRRIGFVVQKLTGQQLPNNLRQFIWSDILFKNERKNMDPALDIELLVRKNFAAGVTRGKNDLKLKDPTQTPVTALIENAVIETYSKVLPMQFWLEEQHLRQTMKVLNVLYTYSKDYEPYYIYWLLPFQLTFKTEKNKSELIYDLAMYLDLYAKNCFPSWSEVFTISGKVVSDLANNDTVFYEHLKLIAKKNAKVNPKDFVNEIIYNEGKKANGNYLIEANNEINALKINKELLSDPLIFLRKWIGEGFAGVLNANSLLYVWDQLFMSGWASKYIEAVAKVLLYLLRERFLKARDYDEMRQVFLEEPCKLYTLDIQSAFMHYISGGRETEMAGLNKRNYEPSYASDGPSENYNKYLKNNFTGRKKATLDPIGFKNIRLLLTVPKQGLTNDFDPTRVSVEVALYYYDTKLNVKSTETVALVRDIKSSLQETKIYDLEIPSDVLAFNFNDYEKEIDNYTQKEIFAIVSVKYTTITYNEVYLGYCRVPIYKPQKIGSISTWEVTQGEITRFFHPGAQPFDLHNISEVPKASYKDRLGPNSCISFHLFNPLQDEFLTRLAKTN